MAIPITTANCEKSFRKLKLIKICLPTTMTEERPKNLALISTENVSELDINKAINVFVNLKSRK